MNKPIPIFGRRSQSPFCKWRGQLILTMLLVLVPAISRAANPSYQYTANTGGATTTDGAGTWSTGAANWRLNNTGTAVVWGNSPVWDAIIGAGGAGGTITPNTSFTVGNITFPTVTSPYTIAAGGTITLSGTPTITINNSGGATITAPLSGSFNVSGSGTLTLNAASAIAGTTPIVTVNSGATVSDPNGGQLTGSSGSATLFLNGGTWSLAGGKTENNFNKLVLANNGAFTCSGAITGNGTQIKTANSIPALCDARSGTIGSSTYTFLFGNNNNFVKSTAGTVTYYAKNINSGAGNDIGTSITINAGTLVFDYSASASTKVSSAGNDVLTFGGGTLNNANQDAIGSGQIVETMGSTTVKPGASAIGVASTTAHKGFEMKVITRNVGGTLNVSANGSSSTSPINATSTSMANSIVGGWMTVAGVDWAGAVAPIAALASGSYTHPIAASPSSSVNYLMTSGADSAVTTSSGTQTANSLKIVSGSGSYTPVTIGGALVLGSGGLLITGTGAGGVTITGGTLEGASGADLVVFNNSSSTLTISSIIANNSSATALTVSGSGTLALGSTANSYTGKNFLNAGTLSIAADGTGSSNPLGAYPGSTVADNITMRGGGLQASASLALGVNRGITLGSIGGTLSSDSVSHRLTVGGVIADTSGESIVGGLIIGGGLVELDGANTYAGGTTLSGGELDLGNNSALGTGTVMVSGGTLAAIAASRTLANNLVIANSFQLGGQGQPATINGSVNLNGGTQTITLADNATFGGVITNGGLTVSGSGKTLTLAGANTYSGNTTVSAGTLKLQPASKTPNPPSGSLLARYTFDNTLNDVSGNGNNGSMSSGSPAYVTGYFSQANNFTGANYVTVPYAASFGTYNSYTMSAWINLNAIPASGANYGIFGTRGGSSPGDTIDIKVTGTGSGNCKLHADIGSGSAWLTTAADYQANFAASTWYLVTYVVDNTAQLVSIYVNGTLATTIPISGTPLFMQTGQYLNIGNDYYQSTELMNGAIDEVCVYGRALSATEVAQLYNGVNSGAGPLPTASPVFVASGAVLDLDGSTQSIPFLSNVSGSGGIVTNSASGPASLTITPASGSTTFSGSIRDSGSANAISLTINGIGGTQILAGNSTYSGTTTISTGTLSNSVANALPSGTTVNLAGGTLGMGANVTVSGIQIAGVTKAKGTWGAAGSGANHISASMTGAGILTASTGGASTSVVTSSANPFSYGNSVTFTNTVTGSGGDGSAPSGTVTFYDGVTVIGTGNLVSSSGTVSTYTLTISSLTVGTHSVTAQYAGNASYDVSTSGVLSQVVNQATSTATVTVNNSAAYDGSGHAATVSVTASNTPGAVTVILTGGQATQTNAGVYAVTVTYVPSDTNYTTLPGLSAGNFTNSLRPITITAQPNTKIYDGNTSATNVPTLTVGTLASGEGFSSLSEAYVTATVGTGKTVIPSATITNAYGSTTANYVITAINNTASVINPAQATTALLLTNSIGTTNQYGQALIFSAVVQTNNATAANASSNVVFSLGSTPVWTNTVTGGVAYYTNTVLTVGVTNFTAQYAGDNNYLGSSVSVTQTVLPATPTLTLTASSITFGQTLTSSSLNGSAATNANNAANVSGSYAFVDNSIKPNAGTTNVAVIFTPSDMANYGNVTNTVSVVVSQAPLGVTANNASKTYDGTGYTGGNGVTYSGFVNGETSAVLGGTLTYGGTSQNATNAGSYTIIPSGLTSSNYDITYTNGTLTIDARGVTVTANGQTKVYGAADPALTYSFTPALVMGDSFSGSLTRVPGQNVGSYAVTQGSLNLSANYTLTYNGTNLVITPAALSVTANITSKTYGQTVTFAGTEFSTSGLQFSDSVTSATLTSAGATNTAIVGSYPIVASAASGPGLGNYNISYVNGTLAVNPASIFVGASSTKNPSGYTDSIAYIATLPADASGSVVFSSSNGPFSTNSVASGSATSAGITSLPRGTNVITVAYLGDGNYFGSTNTLNQIVTNHPPVANPLAYTRSAVVNQIKMAVTNLLSNATDVDGDTLVLASVSATTNGATLIVSGGLVMYYNTNAVADEFTYTVTDGFGGTNSATVTINVDSTPLFGQSILASTTGGTATLNFAGIPNYSYSVLRSTNLTSWTAIWTTNAPASGVFQYIDNSAPQPSAYYQLRYNP